MFSCLSPPCCCSVSRFAAPSPSSGHNHPPCSTSHHPDYPTQNFRYGDYLIGVLGFPCWFIFSFNASTTSGEVYCSQKSAFYSLLSRHCASKFPSGIFLPQLYGPGRPYSCFLIFLPGLQKEAFCRHCETQEVQYGSQVLINLVSQQCWHSFAVSPVLSHCVVDQAVPCPCMYVRILDFVGVLTSLPFHVLVLLHGAVMTSVVFPVFDITSREAGLFCKMFLHHRVGRRGEVPCCRDI